MVFEPAGNALYAMPRMKFRELFSDLGLTPVDYRKAMLSAMEG